MEEKNEKMEVRGAELSGKGVGLALHDTVQLLLLTRKVLADLQEALGEAFETLQPMVKDTKDGDIAMLKVAMTGMMLSTMANDIPDRLQNIMKKHGKILSKEEITKAMAERGESEELAEYLKHCEPAGNA